MKKKNDIAPRKPMTLEEQFTVVSTALARATNQGNRKAMNGLAIMLRDYEAKIAQQSK